MPVPRREIRSGLPELLLVTMRTAAAFIGDFGANSTVTSRSVLFKSETLKSSQANVPVRSLAAIVTERPVVLRMTTDFDSVWPTCTLPKSRVAGLNVSWPCGGGGGWAGRAVIV